MVTYSQAISVSQRVSDREMRYILCYYLSFPVLFHHVVLLHDPGYKADLCKERKKTSVKIEKWDALYSQFSTIKNNAREM